MATIWHPDTCGCYPACEIELNDQGEPARHLRACASHSRHGMDHHQIATECRDKERQRGVHAKNHGVESHEIGWSIDPNSRKLSFILPAKN